jgi:UDP-N-acetylglucosamine 2-epimerase
MLWKFEGIRLIPFTSKKFMIWGNTNYDYYTKQKIEENKLIITGSPRYDKFFKSNYSRKNEKVVLITPEPITEFSGLCDTNLSLRYENVVEKIITIIKKIPDAKIIVKLHPGDDKHNETLLEIFKKIDSSIQIFHSKKTSKLIEKCDILLNITCEINDPSTVMLEGMIFQKPVIEISLDDKTKKMEYQQELPILSLSYKAQIDYYLTKIIQEEEFQNELLLNQKRHLKNFLSNKGNASEMVTKILDSF